MLVKIFIVWHLASQRYTTTFCHPNKEDQILSGRRGACHLGEILDAHVGVNFSRFLTC